MAESILSRISGGGEKQDWLYDYPDVYVSGRYAYIKGLPLNMLTDGEIYTAVWEFNTSGKFGALIGSFYVSSNKTSFYGRANATAYMGNGGNISANTLSGKINTDGTLDLTMYTDAAVLSSFTVKTGRVYKAG